MGFVVNLAFEFCRERSAQKQSNKTFFHKRRTLVEMSFKHKAVCKRLFVPGLKDSECAQFLKNHHHYYCYYHHIVIIIKLFSKSQTIMLFSTFSLSNLLTCKKVIVCCLIICMWRRWNIATAHKRLRVERSGIVLGLWLHLSNIESFIPEGPSNLGDLLTYCQTSP